jgi:hypothetical protein
VQVFDVFPNVLLRFKPYKSQRGTAIILLNKTGHPNHATTRLGASRIIYAGNTDGCFGSIAEVQALNSLTAASERKAATQTKLFNFPD